ILVLGILLYEYVPVSKTIPNEVSYTTPEEVKEELLTSSDVDENQIVMTYEIDSTDLNNYKKIQNYKPGKANPFSSYETQASGSNAGSSQTSGQNTTSNTNTNTSNGSDTSSSSNSSQSTDNTTTSGGKFFQDTGTK
ncbi:MAG: hypothetical protein ACLRQZ_02600, partial [Clostridia bacterium]